MAATVPVAAAASIDQRFAQLIQQFGLTKNSFAISLGKTASVVQHLIDGRNKPGFDLMCKVFEVYPNVSRDWLLLGRGPMLVGSNGSLLRPTNLPDPTAPEPEAEPVFDPIDLADVAPRAPRRPTGTRLHPEEIAATLALASAAASPVSTATVAIPAPLYASVADSTSPGNSAETTAARVAAVTNAAGPAPGAAPHPSPAPPASGASTVVVPRRFRPASGPSREAAPAAAVAAMAPGAPAATPPAEPIPATVAPQPPVAEPAGLPAATSTAPLLGTVGPESYVAAALHSQHLQHQLALAELRNQHLLEQQQMLREMLAMARQSMV